MHRNRNAKIIATLGPASTDRATIQALFDSGADVFRLNFSHGIHADHKARLDIIRDIERNSGRHIGVMLDLQGPKLRLGVFSAGSVLLEKGSSFFLDLNSQIPGDETRVSMPHPEIFKALDVGTDLLVDDGRVCLRVLNFGSDYAETLVIVGGVVSDRKGVNVPDVILPMSALTEKDKIDLEYGLSIGVDWIALSFVQRPEDIVEVKSIVKGRAGIVAKLEKPSAIISLEAIVDESDAIMVARGDLGVEMPPEQVPAIQKRIVRACRKAGKPVIVATQMLESMVSAAVPTRAEASDVATAVYDGVDAVMLSAESASGKFPIEAVQMMDSIITRTEADRHNRDLINAAKTLCNPVPSDAIGVAVREVVDLLKVSAVVAYTSSGYSAFRMAQERPQAPIMGMTPNLAVARRLSLVWGVYSVLCHEVSDIAEVSDWACQTAKKEGLAKLGDTLVITAGVPFGTSGTTNLLRISKIS